VKWVVKPTKERTLRNFWSITRYIPWIHLIMGEVELEERKK
jgi:hypothetical protein